ERGYLLVPGRHSDPAFFPLYPIVLGAAHGLGLGWAVAGPIVSNLGLLVGLVLFHALSRRIVGDEVARRATTYLAVFPLAYVFSRPSPRTRSTSTPCSTTRALGPRRNVSGGGSST